MQGDIPISLPQKTVYFSLAMQMYMAQAIKAPAMQALSVLVNPKAKRFDKLRAAKMLYGAFQATQGLPEPTKENTWHSNTHNLIYLRDWLFQRCFLNGVRMNFIRRIMNFIIILYDFDPPWRWIFDSVREEAMKMACKPRGWNDTWKDTYAWWRENGT